MSIGDQIDQLHAQTAATNAANPVKAPPPPPPPVSTGTGQDGSLWRHNQQTDQWEQSLPANAQNAKSGPHAPVGGGSVGPANSGYSTGTAQAPRAPAPEPTTGIFARPPAVVPPPAAPPTPTGPKLDNQFKPPAGVTLDQQTQFRQRQQNQPDALNPDAGRRVAQIQDKYGSLWSGEPNVRAAYQDIGPMLADQLQKDPEFKKLSPADQQRSFLSHLYYSNPANKGTPDLGWTPNNRDIANMTGVDFTTNRRKNETVYNSADGNYHTGATPSFNDIVAKAGQTGSWGDAWHQIWNETPEQAKARKDGIGLPNAPHLADAYNKLWDKQPPLEQLYLFVENADDERKFFDMAAKATTGSAATTSGERGFDAYGNEISPMLKVIGDAVTRAGGWDNLTPAQQDVARQQMRNITITAQKTAQDQPKYEKEASHTAINDAAEAVQAVNAFLESGANAALGTTKLLTGGDNAFLRHLGLDPAEIEQYNKGQAQTSAEHPIASGVGGLAGGLADPAFGPALGVAGKILPVAEAGNLLGQGVHTLAEGAGIGFTQSLISQAQAKHIDPDELAMETLKMAGMAVGFKAAHAGIGGVTDGINAAWDKWSPTERAKFQRAYNATLPGDFSALPREAGQGSGNPTIPFAKTSASIPLLSPGEQTGSAAANVYEFPPNEKGATDAAKMAQANGGAVRMKPDGSAIVVVRGNQEPSGATPKFIPDAEWNGQQPTKEAAPPAPAAPQPRDAITPESLRAKAEELAKSGADGDRIVSGELTRMARTLEEESKRSGSETKTPPAETNPPIGGTEAAKPETPKNEGESNAPLRQSGSSREVSGAPQSGENQPEGGGRVRGGNAEREETAGARPTETVTPGNPPPPDTADSQQPLTRKDEGQVNARTEAENQSRREVGVQAAIKVNGVIYPTGLVHDYDKLPPEVQKEIHNPTARIESGFVDKNGSFSTNAQRPELRRPDLENRAGIKEEPSPAGENSVAGNEGGGAGTIPQEGAEHARNAPLSDKQARGNAGTEDQSSPAVLRADTADPRRGASIAAIREAIKRFRGVTLADDGTSLHLNMPDRTRIPITLSDDVSAEDHVKGYLDSARAYNNGKLDYSNPDGTRGRLPATPEEWRSLTGDQRKAITSAFIPGGHYSNTDGKESIAMSHAVGRVPAIAGEEVFHAQARRLKAADPTTYNRTMERYKNEDAAFHGTENLPGFWNSKSGKQFFKRIREGTAHQSADMVKRPLSPIEKAQAKVVGGAMERGVFMSDDEIESFVNDQGGLHPDVLADHRIRDENGKTKLRKDGSPMLDAEGNRLAKFVDEDGWSNAVERMGSAKAERWAERVVNEVTMTKAQKIETAAEFFMHPNAEPEMREAAEKVLGRKVEMPKVVESKTNMPGPASTEDMPFAVHRSPDQLRLGEANDRETVGDTKLMFDRGYDDAKRGDATRSSVASDTYAKAAREFAGRNPSRAFTAGVRIAMLGRDFDPKMEDAVESQKGYDAAVAKMSDGQKQYAAGVRRWENPSATDARDARISRKFSKTESEPLYSVHRPGDEEGEFHPTWYSKAEQVIGDKIQGKAGPEQVRQTLLNSGVKPDEMKWSGLDDYLANARKAVTKQELLDHLKENNVQVREVMKGGKNVVSDEMHREFRGRPLPSTSIAWTEQGERWERTAQQWQKNGDNNQAERFFRLVEQATHQAEALDTGGRTGESTKFSQYQLPGGENYRELLMTLPDSFEDKLSAINARIREHGVKTDGYSEWARSKDSEDAPNRSRQFYDNLPHNYKREWEQQAVVNRFIAKPGHEAEYQKASEDFDAHMKNMSLGQPFHGSHWDEPNVLAHIRMNDRTGPNGEKMLHLEEIQSDWHQSGRDKGYKGEMPKGWTVVPVSEWEGAPRSASGKGWVVLDENGKIATGTFGENLPTKEDAIKAATNNSSSVPDAPFQKTWHELALRRALRLASENGYDKMSWTPGEEQNKRYDLSKQVDSVHWSADKGGGLWAYKNGQRVLNEGDVPAEKLPDYIGKDAAKKLLGQTPDERGIHELRGDDLKIGGSGMKGFYDKIVPDYLNKYGKKWGAKVGYTNLKTPPEAIAEMSAREIAEQAHPVVPSIDITPAMKKSVMQEGQPLFSVYRPDSDGNLKPQKQEDLLGTKRAKGMPEPEDEQPKEAEVKGASGTQDRLLPKPESGAEPETTGIKNAVSAVDRERLNLPERKTPEGRSFDEMYQRGKDAVASDPNAESNMLNQLRADPEKILGTDAEAGILLKHKVDLENELQRLRQVAKDTKTPAEEAEAESALSAHRQAIKEFTELAERTGTATGRALAARKMMSAMDYSLSHMEAMAEASKGAPLTKEELARVAADHDAIKAKNDQLQKALDAEKQSHAETQSKLDHATLLKDAVEKQYRESLKASQVKAAAPKTAKTEYGGKNKLFTRDAYEKAKRDLLNSNITYSGLPLDKLAALAKIGAFHIEAGAHSLADFSAKMVSDLGDKIKPHLQSVFDASNKAIGDAKAKDIAGKMRARVTEDGADLHDLQPYLRKMAMDLISGGIRTREPLLDALHEQVKDAFSGITREEVRDALSGYGDYKPLSKEADAETLRHINQQSQKIAQLEALQKGEAPLKTGVERQTPDEETRALTKQVNDAKRRAGIITTDPETQLKTALEAMKTRAKNQIADLQREIDLGERTVKGKSVPISDAELDDLRKQLADVRKAHADVFQKPGLTDEQRLQSATDSAKRNLENWQKRLLDARAGKFDQPGIAPKISTPEIDAIHAQVKAARAEFDELKQAANPPRSASEIKEAAIQKRIIELESRLEHGMTESKGAKQGPDTARITELKGARDKLNASLAELRANDPTLQAKRSLQSATDAADEYERKEKVGDFLPKGKSEPAIPSPELVEARARRDFAKDAYDKARASDSAYQKAMDEQANKAALSRIARQEADLKDHMATGNYGKPKPPPKPMSPEVATARAALARVQQQHAQMKDRFEKANRSFPEKALDWTNKWIRNAALSWPTVLEKLTGAAAIRTLSTPIEQIPGYALSKVFRRLGELAPREGVPTISGAKRAEVAAQVRMWTKGIKGSADMLRNRKTELQLTHDTHNLPPGLSDYLGSLHGALKNPTLENEYARSLTLRTEHAAVNAVDTQDPLVQLRLSNEAYMDAKRSIFMQDNGVVDAWNAGLKRLEAKDKDGKPNLVLKVISSALQSELPIVKVPTNVIAETSDLLTGWLHGPARAAFAYAHGIENLRPEQADAILRSMKKGSVGLAMALLGFYGANKVGGYFQKGEKRDEKDVKPDDVRIGGADIPHALLHNPYMEAMQFGSTVARAAMSKFKKGDEQKKGVPAGLLAATMGLVSEIPFVRETSTIGRYIDPNQQGNQIGEKIRSTAVPGVVQWGARQLDKPTPFSPTQDTTKRKPSGVKETIESGIPGLRQNVPASDVPTRIPKPQTESEKKQQAREGPLYQQTLESSLPAYDRMSGGDKAKYQNVARDKILNAKLDPDPKKNADAQDALMKAHGITPPPELPLIREREAIKTAQSDPVEKWGEAMKEWNAMNAEGVPADKKSPSPGPKPAFPDKDRYDYIERLLKGIEGARKADEIKGMSQAEIDADIGSPRRWGEQIADSAKR